MARSTVAEGAVVQVRLKAIHLSSNGVNVLAGTVTMQTRIIRCDEPARRGLNMVVDGVHFGCDKASDGSENNNNIHLILGCGVTTLNKL